MRRRTTMRISAVAGGLALALLAVVLGTHPATAVPSGPANLHATDLRTDGFTVAWDPVSRATSYSVVLFPLEAFGSYQKVTTKKTAETFDGLMFGVTYQVSVSARIGFQSTAASTITVTTLWPDDYEPLSAPANLRVERDATGRIQTFRWDPSTGGSGRITYEVHVDIPGFLNQSVWVRTPDLTISGDQLPICDGCEYDPSQVTIVWVTAKDVRTISPPSNRLELTCCPF